MAFVGNITLTDEHRRVDGYAVVVVIEVMAGAHTPSITTDDAVEGSDRIKHAGGKLMPETGPPALTVVEGKGRGAVEDFSDGNAAKVVEKTSLMAAGSFSPQNSHIRLPPRTYGQLSQKLRPWVRALLK